MKNKVDEILGRFNSFKKDAYLKIEVIAELFKLQEEMVKETFSSEHAEKSNLRIWDVEKHFEQLNEKCGHVADELLCSFMEQAKDFSEMIKGEISGNKGEALAYSSLQTMSRKHKILRNIELNKDGRRTEIDLIAITNKAVVIIEVKNTGKNIVIDEKGNYCRLIKDNELVFNKNIGEKLNEKEYLLREVLKSSGINDVPIYTIVVFTNNTINVENRYKYFQECFLSQLPHIASEVGGITYEDAKMEKIEHAIKSAKCLEAYPIELDINKFKKTFATLLLTLQEANRKQVELEEMKIINNDNLVFRVLNSMAKVVSLILKK